MTDDLVAYLLDDLPPERRAEVEAKLETDVVWRWELDRLRECMAASGDIQRCVKSSDSAPDALEASHVDLEPPVDLVKKTCCFVEDSASGKFKVEKKRCKKKPAAFSAATCESGGRSWSLADVTVGAGVLLILAALILPAVQRSRDAARNSACTNNMRGIYVATANYADRYDRAIPQLASNDPAGMFFVELVDAGFMSRDDAIQVMTCPNSPQAQRRDKASATRIPSRKELRALDFAEMLAAIEAMNISYALPLGYRDDDGEYRQTTLAGNFEAPLIADAPAVTSAGIQPVNHGCLQNVLTKSGCIDVMSSSVLPRGNEPLQRIHLNDRGELSAGCNENDSVLAPANCSRDGLLGLSMPRTMRVEKVFVIQFGPSLPNAE